MCKVPLTLGLARPRQGLLQEFEPSLVYKVSVRPAKCYIVSPSKKDKKRHSPLMMIFKEITLFVCACVGGSVCTHIYANVYLGAHGGQTQVPDHLEV